MSKSFTLIKEQQIPEINSVVQLYEHKRTGARLLSVINDDENKVFSINFRTTPKDSTGVAHILEHSVLNGSEKYPVKEPFVELLKGSLATFVNAFALSPGTPAKGLNDYVVAHSPPARSGQIDRVMAHDRTAPTGYTQCFRPNVKIKNGKARVTPSFFS